MEIKPLVLSLATVTLLVAVASVLYVLTYTKSQKPQTLAYQPAVVEQGRLIYRPAGFSMYVGSDWSLVSKEEQSLPPNVPEPKFIVKNETAKCVMAYVETDPSLNEPYKQTSFGQRVYVNLRDTALRTDQTNVESQTKVLPQIDSDWRIPSSTAPANLQFKWEGRQSLPGEVRFASLSMVVPIPHNVPQFLIYAPDHGPVSNMCDTAASDAMRSIRVTFQPTSMNESSEGYVYIQPSIFGLDSSPTQYVVFSTAPEYIPKIIGSLHSNGMKYVLHDNKLWYTTADTLISFNPFLNASTTYDLSSGQGSVLEFLFHGDTLFYVRGPSSCNQYMEKCTTSVHQYSLKNASDTTLMTGLNLKAAKSMWLSKDANTLYISSGDGDAGCFVRKIDAFSLSQKNIIDSAEIAACADEQLTGERKAQDVKIQAMVVDTITATHSPYMFNRGGQLRPEIHVPDSVRIYPDPLRIDFEP